MANTSKASAGITFNKKGHMDKNILIFGKGYIGARLAEAFDCPANGDMLSSLTRCIEIVAKARPKVVINCIGYTGARNVDDCESEKDMTITANSFVPVMLAEACLRNNARFVHISSGCIFEYDYAKDRPIDEKRLPDYYDLFYSRSKVYAERCLDYLQRRYPILTVRLRIPLDNVPSPKNILTKLIKYRQVIDIPNSVTYIPDFVRAVKHLVRKKETGLFNVVNKGGLRYPELLAVYRKFVPDFDFEVVSLSKLRLERTNLLLSTRKLEATGFKVRHIDDVLEECVEEYIGQI